MAAKEGIAQRCSLIYFTLRMKHTEACVFDKAAPAIFLGLVYVRNILGRYGACRKPRTIVNIIIIITVYGGGHVGWTPSWKAKKTIKCFRRQLREM